MNLCIARLSRWFSLAGKVLLATLLALLLLPGAGRSNPVYADSPGWTSVGTATPTNVYVFLQVNDTLYAGTGNGSNDVWSYRNGEWTQMSGSPSYVKALEEVNGTLYAGSVDGSNGVWAYHDGTWTQMIPSPRSVMALLEEGGTLYAGTQNSISDDIWAYDGGTWTQMSGSPGYVGTLLDVNGTMYAGAENDSNDIWTYRQDTDGTWKWTQVSNSPSNVDALFNAGGTLYAGGMSLTGVWSGSQDGSGAWNWAQMSGSPSFAVAIQELNDTLYALRYNVLWSASQDSDGNWSWSKVSGAPTQITALKNVNGTLYVGTSRGVYTYRNGMWGGMPSNPRVLQDVNGTLYAGSDDGVWSLNDGMWVNLTGSPAQVYSLVDVNGTLYAGTSSSGIWSYRNGAWTQVIGSLSNVQALMYAHDTLYAGTGGGVWSAVQDSGGIWTWTPMSGSPGSVTALQDANGALIAGTWGGGIWSYDQDSGGTWAWTSLPGSPGSVYSLLYADGTLYAGAWIGGNDVWSYRNGTWAAMSGSPSDVHAVIEANGTLYAGTLPGVWSADRDRDGTWTWTSMSGSPYDLNAILAINNTVYAASGRPSLNQVLIHPAAPARLQTGGITSTSVKLTWDGVFGATGYNLYENGTGAVSTVTGDVYSYTWGGLTPATLYTFTAKAFNEAGESPPSGEIQVWTAPDVPTGLTASAGDSEATLSWTDVPGATYYKVYARPEGAGYGAAFAAVSGPPFTVTGLTNGSTYDFVVAASNEGGDSGVSNEASATPRPDLAVVYDGNGATSGSVPVDSGIYTPGVTVSVYGNTENLAKTGYTFAGWNTAADGSGTSYEPGSSLTLPWTDVTLYARWLSANALLTGLSVNQGAGTLSPAFAPGTNDYTASVGNGTSAVTVTPTAADSTAAITVNGTAVPSGHASGEIPLQVGDNTISVAVTAQDGTTEKTYTVTIRRAGPSRSSGTSAPPVPQDNEGRVFAIPRTTGETISADGICVRIPAAALGSDFTLTVDTVADTAGLKPRDGSLLASGVYSLVKDKTGNFDKTVTVTLIFDPAKWGKDQFELAVCWFNEETRTWVKLDNIAVDWSSGTVSGDVRHFTKFAVIAAKKADQTPAPSPAAPAAAFRDIQDHWAREAINRLAGLGVIHGYGDGSFRPDREITRAEFVTMAVKAFGLKPAVSASTFKDTERHWAEDAIAAAVSEGVASGYDAERFGPDDPITREQMAVMLMRAAGIAKAVNPAPPADEDQVSAWAREAVDAVRAAGILTGYPDGSFKPQGKATRAEAVAAIARCLAEPST